ncbi:hypothetical protein RG959_10365 [Domibacillus sp. 8LH]|uniref:hypothetical protein n=1 Tax=Domibacillus sp. 8LH TaxID=3073900 RepID=UPI00317E058E
MQAFKEIGVQLASRKVSQINEKLWIEEEEQAMSMTESIKGWYLSGSNPHPSYMIFL